MISVIGGRSEPIGGLVFCAVFPISGPNTTLKCPVFDNYKNNELFNMLLMVFYARSVGRWLVFFSLFDRRISELRQLTMQRQLICKLYSVFVMMAGENSRAIFFLAGCGLGL